MWAVIGGSGFESFSNFAVTKLLDRETPFGRASSGLSKAMINGIDLIFLPRHGKNHECLPTEINYKANIYALKKYGASKIIAISSVGSLRSHLAPGDMVIPLQYINRTTLRHGHTFSGNGLVGHVSLAKPVTEELVDEVKKVYQKFYFKVHFNCTAVCIEGPYFSTQSESLLYRSMGADIVGMTAFPEYALAREAGICYLPCSFVTDFDSWDDTKPYVVQQEISQALTKNNHSAYQLVQKILPFTKKLLLKGCPELGLKASLITKLDTLSREQQAILELFSR